MAKHKTYNLTQKLRVAAAILMVSSLGLFYPGTVSNLHAQSPAKATPASSAGGPKEGIKVHGHWTIEVRNPDGKLVERRQFKNGLSLSGAYSLAALLQRTHTAREWTVELTGTEPPCLNGSQPYPCYIFEVSSLVPGNFKTLVVSSQAASTVLAGTATAQRDGTITIVRTRLVRCLVRDPNDCTSNEPFTGTAVSAINVVAGQIIQVTVVLSFS